MSNSSKSNNWSLSTSTALIITDGILIIAGIYSLLLVGDQLAAIIGEMFAGQLEKFPFNEFRWGLFVVAGIGALRAKSVQQRLSTRSNSRGDPVEY
jgi:putative Ca2+/H+ antiporter (TMEM165/GDT1 family)